MEVFLWVGQLNAIHSNRFYPRVSVDKFISARLKRQIFFYDLAFTHKSLNKV